MIRIQHSTPTAKGFPLAVGVLDLPHVAAFFFISFLFLRLDDLHGLDALDLDHGHGKREDRKQKDQATVEPGDLRLEDQKVEIHHHAAGRKSGK